MQECKKCIHFKACEDWARNFGLEGLQFPFECEDDELLCDQYNPQTLPPAYIGMKVWIPWVFRRPMNEIYSEIKEGHVSGLQQKADGSWKIRCTRNGSVADYTIEEFNECCFLNKEDAEKRMEEKINELANE